MEGAPRGRGVGLPQDVVFKCSNCGHTIDTVGTIEKDATCSSCGSALHSCSNCNFFDSGFRFECRKPLLARVESKTKVNDCKYFQPKAVRDLSSRGSQRPDDPRAAFDALFKK
jgi:DNA-directed RNA polymerase subunit RPC12/RpoP